MFIRLAVTAILGLVPAFVCPSSAYADGLIYRLPPDGTWVRYRGKQEATEAVTLDGKRFPDFTIESTLTLRSVGQVTTDGDKARWIELEWKIPPAEARTGRIIILKMLIPEDDLRRGRDPLAGVEELYFWDRDWEWKQEPEAGVKEKVADPPRVLYEIERFRFMLPFPPRARESQLETVQKTVAVPHGTYAVQRISYPLEFEGKLSGGKGGRWEWKGTFSLDICETVGFGVVALDALISSEEEYANAGADGVYRLSGVGSRMKAHLHMELEASGDDAKSAMPEFPN
jgi:hypothetical protein